MHTEAIDAMPQFERLVHEHAAEMFRAACHYAGDVDAGADLLQDVTIKALVRREQLAAMADARPWFRRVLRNQSIDEHRRRSREVTGRLEPGAEFEPGLADLPAPWQNVHAAVDPVAEAERLHLLDKVADALAELGEDLRRVIVLADIDGASMHELVEELEVPVGTVKSRLHRARARLRQALTAPRQAA